MTNLFKHGFLGTQASFMMDFVFIALFILIPLLLWSVSAIRNGNQQLHHRLQVLLTIIFLVAFILFEVDVNYLNPDWKSKASNLHLVGPILLLHIPCAILTLICWPIALYKGLKYSKDKMRNQNNNHRIWGKRAFSLMLGTASTGVLFHLVVFPFFS
jgi:uncharacterized membrane protein YozB (DUF420 family)